jgi:2-octaprenylphenol hydroxylase
VDTLSQAESSTSVLTFDIAITGGGMVGMTLALALAKNPNLSIVVLESNSDTVPFSADHYHHRVSAIALSSVAIFQSLQVWDNIKKMRVSPFRAIQVWDSSHQNDLKFAANEIGEPVLGYIIENSVIQNALLEQINGLPNIQVVSPVNLISFNEAPDYVSLKSDDHREFRASLAIAADGARSWLRNQAGIDINSFHYDQEAIVVMVKTALPHEKIARQVFLPSGPLAFLPLNEPDAASIVWSLPCEEAQRLAALPEDEFKLSLQHAFANRLGDICHVGKRFTLPLKKQQAKQYVRGRVALVGDAAHVIHPLAGQGVNIGLLDAASLAEVFAEGVHPYQYAASLRRYERWRRADNLALLAGVDLIKNLFASDKLALQAARSLGMLMTSKLSLLKSIFTRYAIGNRSGLPILAKPSHTDDKVGMRGYTSAVKT